MLTVSGLHVQRGTTMAVRGVDLNVGDGELVAVVGPNGAGKTSLLRGIVGLESRRGSVRFEGSELPSGRPLIATRAGLALVPEGRHIFGPLTIRENLILGTAARAHPNVDEDIARWTERFPVLRHRLDQPAGTLSGGEQQMLAIARALMARPSLLLLDEPSLGLAPMVIDQVFDVLAELHAEGLSILLVEQAARRAILASDRAYVMVNGAVRASGSSDDLAGSSLLDAYFGVVS
jgi:branched-chain amino acid transport system ATP-binding protein